MTPEKLLSDLIQIPSVNPPGNETPVAVYLRDLFSAAGIPSLVVESEPGRGSFVATLGQGERRLLFLSHTDVVPAGDGWAFDPFGGAIIEGHVCGRGALDCKGLVAAQAAAVLRLAREGGLNGTLIFAATADEERGGRLGVQYLLTHHPELLRADFAVNEGGEE
ncbi:MAG: M20/M25/M40 family metallo-hydrolase, partial [Firmicutes bacterium]|nr:M20/M25/M40 family metallo-hydrolase [Bacillota bacterium]